MDGNRAITAALAAACLRDEARALRYLLEAAQSGDRDAMVMYAEYRAQKTRDGLPQSFVDRLRRLCGLPDMRYCLYASGWADKECRAWLERAAEMGSTRAMAILGAQLAQNGQKEAAIPYLARAARGGNWMAAVALNAHYGMKTQACLSDEEYERELKRLRKLSCAVNHTGAMHIQNARWCEPLSLTDKGQRAREDFFALYIRLLYGERRQLSRLARLTAAGYLQGRQGTHPWRSMKALGFRDTNLHCFSYLPMPCHAGIDLSPVTFSYIVARLDAAYMSALRGDCQRLGIRQGEWLLSHPMDDPLWLRLLLVNLDAFEDEPLLALEKHFIFPLKGAALCEPPKRPQGREDEDERRMFVRLRREKTLLPGVGLYAYQNALEKTLLPPGAFDDSTPVGRMLAHPSTAAFGFIAEKEFDVSVLLQYPDPEEAARQLFFLSY